jgi:ketosteroid isomerase-like protein
MKKLLLSVFLVLPMLWGCESRQDSRETWKKEIEETEKEFSAMAQQEGIPAAFLAFAADDAVLMRNNILVVGKEAIKESLGTGSGDNASLTWEPDFVDVAASGDLGYTYGKYIYTLTDSAGNKQVQEGIFHTVWKRQQDGSWKFVWD